jgi:hypothetical protein
MFFRRLYYIPGRSEIPQLSWNLMVCCNMHKVLPMPVAVVSMLASSTQDRGFKPGRSRRILSGVKFLSMPSFGREVKQFVLCRRFVAHKRTLLDYVEVEPSGQIIRTFHAQISLLR